mgnify:CR=1 FL=1
MESAIAPSERGVEVERWPSELPLFVLVLAASLGLWLLLALTILGLVYAVLIGVVLFFAHVAFVTHLRGSAVEKRIDTGVAANTPQGYLPAFGVARLAADRPVEAPAKAPPA